MLWSVVVVGVLQCVAAFCPWDEAGLEAWSDPNTWGGTVPGNNSKVVISGKKVLLDVSSLDLATIEISSDAVLIWADVDIKLTVSYILVNGELHIGSTDCPYTKDAHIFLTGNINSPHSVAGFGRKFIGVTANATLEIHGAKKKAWTKLIQSVPAVSSTCGVVYSVEEQRYARSDAFGLHVTVWNIDGSLNDFNVYPLANSDESGVETDFKNYVESLDAGLIVAIAVYGDLGVTEVPGRNWEDVYSSIEQLGGLNANTGQIRNIDAKEAYAFITMKGDATSTSEQYVDEPFPGNVTRTSIQKFVYQERALEFRTKSIVSDENQVDFEVLTTEVSQPKITVRDDVSSWNTGDKIIVTSTDFDWRQLEEFKILDCPDCSNNQIKLDGAFQYLHYGKITHGVDERAEVALLTRNIKIEGELQPTCYDDGDPKAALLCEYFNRDTFGAHVKFVRGFKSVHVEGVELYHMGQQLLTGTYPLHYHMCDDVDGSWLRNNSIHRSNNRCITIHGTDGAELSDNVCWDHLGHGYFLEDSAEQRNILDGNLGVGTQYGTQLLTDMHLNWCPEGLKVSCNRPSTYWITHPNNNLTNNVAAGSERSGFFFTHANKPLTISAARQAERGLVTENHARYSRVALFDRNVAHSNRRRGVMFDAIISNGDFDNSGTFIPENGIFAIGNYDPREEPNKQSPRAASIMKRFTGYKNTEQNIWSRGGTIIYDHASIADAEIGVLMEESVVGTTQELRNSVVIGETDNLGMPLLYKNNGLTHNFERSFPLSKPNTPMVGLVFFFGVILVENTFFDKFNPRTWNSTWETEYDEYATRRASAIGFQRNFPYPSFPHSGVEGADFGFCDKVDGLKVFAGNSSLPFYENPNDGDPRITFRDYDGSITGIAGVQFVRNTPFFLDYDCYFDNNYQMSVCPHEYAMLRFRGTDGVFKAPKRSDYPLYVVRDDVTDHPFALRGNKNLEYLTMYNKSYMAVYNGTNPTDVGVQVYNLVIGSYIRIALCFPKGTTNFTIFGRNPRIDQNRNLPISVNSIADLEADTTGRAYFWDNSRGLFFFRFVGTAERQSNDEFCPGSGCPALEITRHDGGTEPIDCFNDAYVNGPYKVTPQSPDPITPPTTPCVRAEIDGRGAVDPAELLITAPELTQTCHTFDSDKVSQPCGENNVGYRIGSGGKCYAVVNQFDSYIESKYLCYRMGGILAPIPDLGTQREIRNHIYRFGETKEDYWVNGGGESEETFMEMQFNNYYNPISIHSGNKNGAICLFDYATTPCRTGWTHIGNNCYLFEDFAVQSYTEAEEYCNGEFMSILSIENAEENEAVRTFVSDYKPGTYGGVLLAYKYSSANNLFEWQDGETTTYAPWSSGQGVDAVAAKGDCARLLVRNGKWKNTPCDKLSGRLVCKTSVNV